MASFVKLVSLFLHSVKQLVGKTPRQRPAKPTIVNRVTLRIADQRPNCSVNFNKELCTEARSLILVPVLRFAQIALGPRPNDETPFHFLITASGEI